MRSRRAWRLLALPLALSAAACASAPQHAVQLSLPRSASAHPLASTTLFTSPDGGIYQNPDHLDVQLVMRHAPDEVLQMLPGSAPSWQGLRGLGAFTFIGVAVRNDGKAGSDPQLNALQIASDFAPAGTASGPLRQYYHPMFPLAMLSAHVSDANCTLHVDPGEQAVAVLVYPPISASNSIVWGVYQSFALRLPFGGALTQIPAAWTATACLAPQAPPPAS